MKNIFLSLLIFVVMSLLNAQFGEWSLGLIKEHPGGIAMMPIAIFIECMIASVVGLLTVLLFRKTYDSILKSAILFEIIYLVILILSGTNPFQYFFGNKEISLLDFLLYVNSFIIFLIIFLFHLLYSKIIVTKSKK